MWEFQKKKGKEKMSSNFFRKCSFYIYDVISVSTRYIWNLNCNVLKEHEAKATDTIYNIFTVLCKNIAQIMSTKWLMTFEQCEIKKIKAENNTFLKFLAQSEQLSAPGLKRPAQGIGKHGPLFSTK